MTKLFRILPIALAFFSMSTVAVAQNTWTGSYLFEEDGGKNAGGAAIFISHELNIFEGDDGLVATLQSNGHQTSAELVCSTKVDGSRLMIYFESYGENNRFEHYKPGDLLFSLERKAGRGKTVILTHWGKFTPAIPRNEKSGQMYFEKAEAPKK